MVGASYRLNLLDKEQKMNQVEFYFNDKKLIGQGEEPIAAALLANGIRSFCISEITGESRGIYCGIGHCYECRAEVDGIPNVRTCLTPIQPGMKVSSAKPIEIGGNDHEG